SERDPRRMPRPQARVDPSPRRGRSHRPDGVIPGFAGPSQSPERTALAGRVLPAQRQRGLGSELLERVLEHADGLGARQASGMVFEDDPESIAWVTNRGFEEYQRQFELSRPIDPSESEASPPDGITIDELDESRLREADAVWVEASPDMALLP